MFQLYKFIHEIFGDMFADIRPITGIFVEILESGRGYPPRFPFAVRDHPRDHRPALDNDDHGCVADRRIF